MRSYDKRVTHKEFSMEDLVLRKVLGNTKVKDRWKARTELGRSVVGAYRLADLDGYPVPRP